MKGTKKTSPVDWCEICDDGCILVYSKATYQITRYDLAGQILAQHEFISQLSAVAMDTTKQYVFAGSERGEVFILRVRDLADATIGDGICEGFSKYPKLPVGVHFFHVGKDVVFIGCANGQLLVMGK